MENQISSEKYQNTNGSNKDTSNSLQYYWRKFWEVPYIFRVLISILLIFVMIWLYIIYHIPNSFLMGSIGGATTSITHKTDVVVTSIICSLAALLLGPAKLKKKSVGGITLFIVSIVVILMFMISGIDLYLRQQQAIGLDIHRGELSSWISPNKITVTRPTKLSYFFLPYNFNPTGIILSFITLANTFREICWYWFVVPVLDTEYSHQIWPYKILIIYIFTLLLETVAAALSITATYLQLISEPFVASTINVINQTTARYKPVINKAFTVLRLPAIRQSILTSLVLIATVDLIGVVSTWPHAKLRWEKIHTEAFPSGSTLGTNNIITGVDGRLMLAATSGYGVITSFDFGKTWEFSNTGLKEGFVQELLVITKGKIIFASTSRKIFCSHDNGKTWNETQPIPLDQDYPNQTMILGPDGEDIFILKSDYFSSNEKNYSAIFRSEDNGASWVPANHGLENIRITTIGALDDGKTVFAADYDGKLYQSNDNGDNWVKSDQSLGVLSPSLITVKTDKNVLLFANTYKKVSSKSGVATYYEGPSYWYNARTSEWEVINDVSEAGFLKAAVYLPNDHSLLTAFENGFYKYNLNSKKWTLFQASYRLTFPKTIYSLAFNPSVNKIFASTEIGIYISSDYGLSWMEANQNITFQKVSQLFSTPYNTFVKTNGGAIFLSDPDSGEWASFPHPQPVTSIDKIYVDQVDPKRIVMGSVYGQIAFTLDGGETWNPIPISPKQSFQDFLYVPETKKIVIVTRNNNSQFEIWESGKDFFNFERIYTSPNSDRSNENFKIFKIARTIYVVSLSGSDLIDSQMFFSDVYNKAWQVVSIPHFVEFKSLTINYETKRLFAIGTREYGEPSVVIYSDNYGSTWYIANKDIEDVSIASLEVSPDQKNIVAASYNRGVYVSRDNGANWRQTTAGINNLENCTSLSVDHKNQQIYLGTSRGVFRSLDNGNSWEEANTGISDVVINLIVVSPSDGAIIANNQNYIARSSDGGISWQNMNFKNSYYSLDEMLFVPQTDIMIAKVTSGYASILNYYDRNLSDWISFKGSENSGDPCSYDCEIAVGPDGESIYLFENYGKVWLFNRDTRTWEHFMDVPNRGSGSPISGVYINADSNRFTVTDATGDYQIDPGKKKFINKGGQRQSKGNSLPVNLHYGNIRVSVIDGKISLSRPGLGWLRLSSYTDYPPKAIRVEGNKVIYYASSSSNVLLRAEEQLPFIWTAPNFYLAMIIKTWNFIHWVLENSIIFFSGFAILAMIVFSSLSVRTSVSAFRRRVNESTSLEQFIVNALPLVIHVDYAFIEKALRAYGLIADHENLIGALSGLSKRGLINYREGAINVSEAIPATIYHILSPKNLLEQIANQVRHEDPLVMATEKFIDRAGFTSLFSDRHGVLYGSTLDIWKDVSPIYVYVVVEKELTLQGFQQLTEAAALAFGGNPTDHTILIVLDRPPRAGDLHQIFAQRSQRQLNLVPLTYSIINASTDGLEKTALREQIDTYLGHYDLYNIRSAVSDVLSFFGRSITLANLQKQLTSGRSVAIFGVRKVGKSSLMNRLQEEINWVTAVVDLEGYSSGLNYIYGDISQKWYSAFRSRYPQLNEAVNNVTTESIHGNGAPEFRHHLETLLNLLNQQPGQPGLLLFLDEMDILFSNPDYLEFASLIRSLTEDPRWQGRLVILIAGLDPGINRLDRIQGGRNPFYSFFSEFPIGPLTIEDTKTMIISIGGQMGYSYTEDALALIADTSGGHPFLARQLCSLAIRELERPGTVDIDRARQAIEAFLSATRNYLSESLWSVDTGGPAEEEVFLLKALSKTKQLSEVDLIPPDIPFEKRRPLQLALDSLIDQSLVKRVENCWLISIPIYREWIRKNILNNRED